jgi:hypothetical protein
MEERAPLEPDLTCGRELVTKDEKPYDQLIRKAARGSLAREMTQEKSITGPILYVSANE